MKEEKNIQSNTVVGTLIIIIGGLFLMSNFGLFPQHYLSYIFKWQTILIFIGIIAYFNSGNKIIGILISTLGIIGYIPNSWALLLILLGIYIIYKQNYVNNISDAHDTESKGNSINDISIFGGSKKVFQTNSFTGGNITSIFGGSEIDFLDSSLSDGNNRLNIFFFFGGSKLRVPSNWEVVINVTQIFGSFKDNRIKSRNEEDSSDNRLIITGIVLFGGGEINNYISF